MQLQNNAQPDTAEDVGVSPNRLMPLATDSPLLNDEIDILVHT